MAKSPTPKLAVITAKSAADQLAPPEHLGAVAAELWRTVISTYTFDDPASLRILAEACSALDRSERCRVAISEDGEAVRSGRGGMLRAHPLLTAELQSRALACRLLQRLGLDLEPIRSSVGRPPGGVGVSWDQLGRAD